MKVFSLGKITAWFAVPVLLGLLTASPSLSAVVKWVVPPPGSIVTSPQITVKGYISEPLPPGARLIVKRPENPVPVDEYLFPPASSQLFSAKVNLVPGRNILILDKSVMPLYYQADPSAKLGKKEAEEFLVSRVHKITADDCEACHWVYDKELALTEEIPGLCDKCHPGVYESKKPIDSTGHHERTQTKYCVACHDPHSSTKSGLVKGRGDPCLGCHQKMEPQDSPAGGHEKCVACHDPHKDSLGKMLKIPAEGLCRSCHNKSFSAADGVLSVHMPVDSGPCEACHGIHRTGLPHQLKADGDALCAGCHPKTEFPGHSKKIGACSDCHTGHVSGKLKLLKADAVALCLGCHETWYADGGGHKVSGEDSCFQCHNPHAPKTEKRAVVLCGSCHNMSTDPFTYDHAKLPIQTIEQCLFCHEMHARKGGEKIRGLMRGQPHYPIKGGGCGVCHVDENGRIALRYQGSQNCIRCHGQTVGTSSANEPEKIHAPIRQDDCVACHSPHYKKYKFMLIDEPDKVCEFCHGMITRMGDNRHEALDNENGCRLCHVPHFSDIKPLLKEGQPGICLKCHPGLMPKEDDNLAHGAMREGLCADCHSPHSSEDPKLLKFARGELCAYCHQEVLQSKDGKPFAKLHGPVGANQCLACHYMGHKHRAAGDKFLEQKEPWKVCSDCHEITDAHIPSVYLFQLARNQNGCLGCHAPHGADNGFMLRQ